MKIYMNDVTKIFKALSDNTRLRILKMLEKKQLCVCELTKILGLSTPNVSIHLSVLRDAGFITAHKVGKWTEFSLNTESNNIIISQLIESISTWLNDDEQIMNDKNDIETVDRNVICNT